MNTTNNIATEALNTKYVLDGSPTISISEVAIDIFLPNDDYLSVVLNTEYNSYQDCVEYQIVETCLTDSDGDEVDVGSYDIESIVEDVWSGNDLSDKCYMEMVDDYHSGR